MALDALPACAMRPEAPSSTPTLTTLKKEEPRPRRQTDSAVGRPPLELLREPSGRSVDSSPRPGEPQKHWAASAAGHSPLSVHNLSNPALAEIPSRKFNALRSATASAHSSNCASAPASVFAAAQTAPDPRDPGHKRAGLSPSAPSDIIAPPSTATTSSPSIAHLKTRRSLPGLALRSLQQKRPPASHSSHGVETANGPPPALSTQRSLAHERFRRPAAPDPSSHLRIQRSCSQPSSPVSSPLRKDHPSPAVDAVLKSGATAVEQREQSNSSRKGESADSKAKMSSTTTYVGESALGSDKGRAVGGVEMQNANDSGRDSSPDETRSRSEDIFLNIAKSHSSRRESAGRRSKFGFSTLSSRTSRTVEQIPSPEQSRFDDPLHSPLPYSSAASAHPLDEHSRLRYFGVGSSSRSTISLPRSRFSQTNQDISSDSPERPTSLQDTRTYRQSNLSAVRTNRQTAKSDVGERSRLESDRARQDGTESTLSTTAPSSVWDELDDLKSRIRKLELTGKLPASSAAAMSNASGERPRTATTTVTTLSSSPQQGRKTSAPSGDSEATTTVNQIQTLLHSALAKAKAAVSSEVYRALDATATDALTLSNMLSSNANTSSSSSIANGYNRSERQAKRKADSVCRSLTELCLALSDEKLASLPKKRPASRDADRPNGSDGDPHPAVVSYRRSVNNEPEELPRPHTTSRIPSRLDVRRVSTIYVGASNGLRSPQDVKPVQTPTFSTPPPRLSRLSSLRARRLQGEEGSDDRPALISRFVSRAMAEIGNSSSVHRLSPRDRLSVNIESQQGQNLSPQQQQQPRTPTTQSAIPLRRSYTSAATYIPTAASANVQPGFRRYGLSSTISQVAREDAEGPLDVHGSPQELVSRTRIVVPSSKFAASYTPIQSRLRTDEFGTRRISIRQRLVTIAGDGLNIE